MPISSDTVSAAPVINRSRTIAINSAAAELNRGGFRGAVARRDPSFDHSFEILQIGNESIKHRPSVVLADLGDSQI
jgi:hypothetical protein